MIDHWGGGRIVLEGEADHALGLDLAVALPEQRLAADEATLLVPGDDEAKARLDGCLLIGNVMAPVAVGLLHAAVVHGVHTGGGEAEFAASLPQALEDMGAEFGRDVELPAEFAHIGDAACPNPGIANLDLPRGAEGEGDVGEIGA